MRLRLMAIMGFALLGLCLGYTQDNTFTGTWEGDIQEKGHKAVMVRLTLKQSSEGITGTLSILSETSQDVEKGASFAVVQSKQFGNHLSFMVLITGELNDDAVVFELHLQGNRLEGYGHELREGSERLEVQFLKGQ